jgi:2-oxoglutarate dehydrogenase E1 component
VALAVLLHGDAAFAGQGVVAETLNLQDLEGYATGGTLHLITNNQIGFTTDPSEGRSTRYSSDLAKGFDVPIIHVNADDPEAAVAAVRLAMAYRKQFAQDVVIDLVGYRRFGHNEQDEAAYTQPLMVEQINAHPSVRELYQEQLVAEGVLTSDEAEAFVAEVESVLRAAHERLRASIGDAAKSEHDGEIPRGTGVEVTTAVAGDRLTELNEELLAVPEGFTVHPKLARQLERRRVAIDDGGIDWGQAESLAYASLLVDGIPIRLTGQDTQRGTFAQRHLVLHDSVTGETHTPMQHVEGAQASFEVFNSPLSEYACVGFEYGYSAAAPEALVLWEAQYGDFANGAQIVIDQFISSGLSKWRETSRLTLLLPHGYEGNGPEHSSARLERFLQLAAQENIRVANCTTSAQYFHLLRLQALDPTARPLVVVTPKGLLRLKDASSTLADLADGSFQPVLDDPGADKAAVRRLVLCAGKVYYDLVGNEAHGSPQVALARVEQLYPFPTAAVTALISSYPQLLEVVWAQEEPQNMGPWRSIRHRLEEAAAGRPLRYIGRPWRASPSEGYPTAHGIEQDRIARAALVL